MARARRTLRFTPRPGRYAMQGLSMLMGLPVAILEVNERALIRLDYSLLLDDDEQIIDMRLGANGCQAALRFAEHAAELRVWGARARYLAGVGFDYGSNPTDGIQVDAVLSNGEVIQLRMRVRSPNRPDEWAFRGMTSSTGVTDLRSAPIHDGGDASAIDIAALDTVLAGRVYRVTDFGVDFGEDFAS